MFDVKSVFSRSKKTVGLDIGSGSLKLVEILDTPRGPVLNHFSRIPLARGVIVEGALVEPEQLTATIQELFKPFGGKKKGIVTSLSGNSVIIKKVTIGLMDEAEVRELIREEASKYLPFDDMGEVNFDFQILGENQFNPNQIDILLVAAKKDIINSYTNAIEAAGLSVMIMDVDSFALETMYEANYDFEENELVAIVNIGASITNINVLKNGVSTFTRDFTLGGNAITEALQQKHGVSFEDAERIKTTGANGDEHAAEELQESLISYADPILMEIERSIDYFRSTSTGEYVRRIYLSGGGAKIPGITQDLYQRLNIETEIVNPFKKIECNRKILDEASMEDIAPLAAVGIGLALRRAGDK
jgi:type IV pilus assembly protein PilM